ncbi:DUF4381 domain-containing protein [Alteromonas sp. KUL49]|uniref:DUF4381 domain-containing protein n=1 Tax=Alteromonas sp. KUL49 TaxID=2480798 RepID=UPI0010FFB3AB|nr:DUF4381 domain-containing protein [Alteromonas sp. KUL49]GEA10399.1 hypothetical protein KUL49_07740 [Alteromonas sp. KUL49]
MQATSPAPSNPLDQLKDIHVPDGVNSWPLDWGWWCLGGIVILVIVVTVWWLMRRYRFNKARREALTYLAEITGAETNWPMLINTGLKRTAMSYFQTEDIAKLSGKPWVEFLTSRLDVATSSEVTPGLTTLQEQLYIPAPNQSHFAQCHQSALVWIKSADLKDIKPNTSGNKVRGQYA